MWFDRIIDFVKRVVDYFGYEDEFYDVLFDFFEEGFIMKEVEKMFDKFEKELKLFFEKIMEEGKVFREYLFEKECYERE